MIYVLFYGLCDWLCLNVRTSVYACEGCQIALRNHCNLSHKCCGGNKIQTTTLHMLIQSEEKVRQREREFSFLNQMLLDDLSASKQTPLLL